jgi:catabolite repression HPr-like protein
MITKSIEIKLPRGLEARPVAELVQLASKYDSTLHIEAQSKKVNAKSIMGMMTFISIMNRATAAKDKIDVIIDGKDENEAMGAIEDFFA